MQVYTHYVQAKSIMLMFYGNVYILRSRDLHVTSFSTSALFLAVLRLMHLCYSHIIILPYANIDRLVYCAIQYRPKSISVQGFIEK